ncbi:MAG: hypothetical protein NTU53_18170 [Planctomycetota bacterium]|nr:hypothetical protein [Planctomycetota bacterium]
MNAISPEFESDCRALLDRFFAAYPDATMQKRAQKALRPLRASEKPLKGKAEGWAAGIIYAVATYDRPPVGVPGGAQQRVRGIDGCLDGDRTLSSREGAGTPGVLRVLAAKTLE